MSLITSDKCTTRSTYKIRVVVVVVGHVDAGSIDNSNDSGFSVIKDDGGSTCEFVYILGTSGYTVPFVPSGFANSDQAPSRTLNFTILETSTSHARTTNSRDCSPLIGSKGED